MPQKLHRVFVMHGPQKDQVMYVLQRNVCVKTQGQVLGRLSTIFESSILFLQDFHGVICQSVWPHVYSSWFTSKSQCEHETVPELKYDNVSVGLVQINTV